MEVFGISENEKGHTRYLVLVSPAELEALEELDMTAAKIGARRSIAGVAYRQPLFNNESLAQPISLAARLLRARNKANDLHAIADQIDAILKDGEQDSYGE